MKKESKEYYSTYRADDNTSLLNHMTVDEILKFNPNHVLEFGVGTGKNLRLIQQKKNSCSVSGIDISLTNVLSAMVKNNLPHVSLGDENYLRHYCNYDVVFTVSCLDHIPVIDGIIQEFKRIANKAIVLAECLDHETEAYYYRHNYEDFGFKLVAGSEQISEGDGRMYYIYIWDRAKQSIDMGTLDDFAK